VVTRASRFTYDRSELLVKQAAAAIAGSRGHHGDADVVIVGGGIVGLATAAALARRRARVTVLDHRWPGEASPAAAGMLAPGVERSDGPAHRFAVAARERYPGFIEEVEVATAMRIPLNREGILELALDDAAAECAAATLAPGTEWIDRTRLHAMEPRLAPAAGAVYYPDDGAVDNVALLRALRALAAGDAFITVVAERAVDLDVGHDTAMAVTESGRRYGAASLVLAAGAWSSTLRGLPRPIPVVPMRGQMYAVADTPLAHVTYGAHGYVVPRGDGTTVVGATMEDAGFEVATTPEGLASVERSALQIAPSLDGAQVLRRWSGLRPVTPDLLPIMGPDPEFPALVYACGHSRNGILLGPLSGDCVAPMALGETPPHDLTPFSIARFSLS
jgi:glycine oxidase